MTLTAPPPQGVLLYDPDCGLCTRTARILQRLTAPAQAAATVAPMTDADLDALAVDPVRARREIPLVRGDGTVVWGARAIAEALSGGPAPLRWVGRGIGAPPVIPVAERIYAWVADNRYRLPGGSESCRTR